MKEKITKLFRTGGSVAVRIPKEWTPASKRVVLRREGRNIVISEYRGDLHDLARRFAKDGPVEFERPPQPETPETKKWFSILSTL